MMRSILLGAAALLATCVGCASGGDLRELAPQINKTLDTIAVRIQPRDVLSVKFDSKNAGWDQPNLTVDLEGNVSFLGVADPIRVAGLTIAELKNKLALLYEKPLQNPRVTVTLQSYADRTVTIVGQVQRPGPIDIGTGRLTLIEAMGRAHPNVYAKLDNILLLRWSDQQNKQLAWRIDFDEDEFAAAYPLYLQPNDVVHVPSTAIGYLNKWVDQWIRRLIPFPIPSPLTGGV